MIEFFGVFLSNLVACTRYCHRKIWIQYTLASNMCFCVEVSNNQYFITPSFISHYHLLSKASHIFIPAGNPAQRWQYGQNVWKFHSSFCLHASLVHEGHGKGRILSAPMGWWKNGTNLCKTSLNELEKKSLCFCGMSQKLRGCGTSMDDSRVIMRCVIVKPFNSVSLYASTFTP